VALDHSGVLDGDAALRQIHGENAAGLALITSSDYAHFVILAN
jgi:hypothetical protein